MRYNKYMAKNYCLPKDIADRLIRAARMGEVIGDIETLYGMTTQERNAAFAKHVTKETAKLINTEFEKAMISNQKTALKTWAKNTFTPEAKKKGNYQTALTIIEDLDKQGVLTPENEKEFLKDLVQEKLGISISPDEAKVISDKAKEIEELAKQTSELGLPTKEYFKAKSDLEKYILKQNPASNLKIFTSVIRRAAMLFSIKSPLVNIESNTVQGIMTAFERRLSTKQSYGLNNDLVKKYVKENMSIYQASGYDLSRITSFKDDKKILGEQIVHSEGEGGVRFVGRVAEDIVFKQMMGAPDVAFASWHFADSANLASTQVALSEGLKGNEAKARAKEIFKDAMLVEPKLLDGISTLVRAQAIADAQYATYTNKSQYADIALKIRGVLNSVNDDLRIGDQVMPFVKTPANVIGSGIDFSGIGLPYELVAKLPTAIRQFKGGEKQALKDSIRTIVRGGLGLTFAFILSTLFDPDEFIGNYPVSQKEQELFDLKNATTNSVKIGNKWVSLDYLGVLAAPFIGIMYAKKYGNTPVDKVVKYYQGVVTQSLKIPGIKEFTGIVKDIQDFTNEKKTGTKELGISATNTILDYIRSSVVPSILNDSAKATDTDERKADIKNDPLARIKASIPGLRKTLPEKKTVFGDTVKAEPAWSTLLFGSRVKTANDDQLVKELIRLDEANQLPSITNIEETSPRVKELKTQIGEGQYKKAMEYYYQLFKNRVQKEVNTGAYKAKNDEDKKKVINAAKDDAVETMLKKYRYQKPKK